MAQDGSSVGSSMARRRVGLDCTAELIDTSPALSGPTGHLHVTRARRQQSSGGAKSGKLCEPIPLASQSTHLDPGRRNCAECRSCPTSAAKRRKKPSACSPLSTVDFLRERAVPAMLTLHER